MTLIVPIVLLFIGLGLLIKSADWLVNGASSLAKKWGVSSLIIGLTIVAFGTSLPELIVSVFAAIRGSTDIAVGNIIGSNIANILLILGISGMISKLRAGHSTIWKEIPFALLASVVLLIMMTDGGMTDSMSLIDRHEGAILLLFFAIFMYYVSSIARSQSHENDPGIVTFSVVKSWLLVTLGVLGLFLGGKLLVDSAVTIALSLGMSEALIGLTIVAVGTSLPELVTSIVAARRGHNDIAIGNIVGSNIFNIFWILGFTSLIHPLSVDPEMVTDAILNIFVTLVLFGMFFVGEKNHLNRWQGVLFVSAYGGYVVYLIFRSLA